MNTSNFRELGRTLGSTTPAARKSRSPKSKPATQPIGGRRSSLPVFARYGVLYFPLRKQSAQTGQHQYAGPKSKPQPPAQSSSLRITRQSWSTPVAGIEEKEKTARPSQHQTCSSHKAILRCAPDDSG